MTSNSSGETVSSGRKLHDHPITAHHSYALSTFREDQLCVGFTNQKPTTKAEQNRGAQTGFALDSGYERTFSKLPKVIQVQRKLQKQKDFCSLINGSFNQNTHSLRSNVWGSFGHQWRRLPMT